MKLHFTFICTFLGLQLFGQAPIDKIFSLSPVFDAAGKILPAPGGSYLIFGKQREESVTYNYDFYLLMVDAAGNELWRKSYGTAGLDEGGSQGLARCAGGWVMVGTSGQNGWMVRVNEQGTVLWSKVIEIPNASNVKLTDVAPVPSGGFIASGYEGGCSGVEMLAVKVSDAGQVDWIEEYTDGEAYGLYVTEGGGAFMMVGENKILKARTATGQLTWMRTIDQTPFGAISAGVRLDLTDVVSTGDHGYAVSGTLVSDGTDYKSAYFVAAGTEYGLFQWDAAYNTSVLNNTSSDITAQSSLHYMPNTQDLLISGLVNGRIVVTRTDLQGKQLENVKLGGVGLYYQPFVIKDGGHYIVVGGISEGFGNVSTWFHRSGENILALQQGTNGQQLNNAMDAMKAYPNPVADVLQVQLPSGSEQTVVLELRDLAGRLLRRQLVDLYKGENQVDLDVSGLSAGMFWVFVEGFAPLPVGRL